MTASKLTLAAIHNGELATAPAGQVLECLRPYATNIEEVWEQEPWLDTVDRETLLTWRRDQAALERYWDSYLGASQFSWKYTVAAAFFNLRVSFSSKFRTTWWKIRCTEEAVTAKHLLAWRSFLAREPEENEELLVLESDAVLLDTTASAVETLLAHPDANPRYVNLAGGFSFEAIRIDGVPHVGSEVSRSFQQFARPVTNTSCAYMVNPAMATLLVDFVVGSPGYARLGIDWLFNSLFMQDSKSDITCLHAQPPVIGHGSMTGVTRSWNPHR